MIAPMKKVSLACMSEDRDKILTALQHSALMMIVSSDTGLQGDDKESSERQRRVDALLKELDKYGEKKGMFSQAPEISEEAFENLSEETVSLCKRLEELIDKRDSLASEEVNLKNTLEVLDGWQELQATGKELLGTQSVEILTGKIPVAKESIFNESLSELEASFEVISKNDKSIQLLIAFLKDDASSVRSALSDCAFEEVRLPIEDGTTKEKIESTRDRIDEISKKKGEIVNTLSEYSKKSKLDIETLLEQYKARADRTEIRLVETAEAFFVEGWVKAEDIDKFKSTIASVTDVFDVEVRDPLEDEDVPTSLKNNKFTSQFEGITDMFNPPKYGDFDPNAIMAPWYWIIFGMMMGDAGYGLMMALLIFLAKKIMKPTGGMEQLMNILFYSSATTIIFGVLFGSYFGEELFPPLVKFTAMSDPIKMLIFTLVIGVLHIFTGMITKFILDAKSGRIWDGVFDQLSWMFIIAGVGLLFIPSLSKVGMVIAIIGAATVLLTAGRAKKGIFGKAFGGLLGLYNITSYFSDILSYSRILALSLATGVVGMVMNMLAGMVQGTAIGFVFSLIIYIVGHIFNLALGLLSAYVHSSRLQYIEFYGKFYEGGGNPFKPFAIKTKYINIKKN